MGKRKSFSAYKNQRKSIEEKQKILDANEKIKKKEKDIDEREFRYQRDDNGNATVVMRFLPSVNDLPAIVHKRYHFFEYRGKWYVENCPRAINKSCPVCRQNGSDYNDDNREYDGKRKQKFNYYANVYIVKDNNNPENNGKVFLYKFGSTIYRKIEEALQPTDESEEPIIIYDLLEGADFKLKIKDKGGYVNYDDSHFLGVSPISNEKGEELSEDEMKKIWDSMYELDEFVDEKQYKSEKELVKRLREVLGDDLTVYDDDDNDDNQSKVEKEDDKTVTEEDEDLFTDDEEVDEDDILTEEDEEDLFAELE